MNREEILKEALRLTCGDRAAAYGPPSVQMQCFGDLVDTYLTSSAAIDHNHAHQMSIIMVLNKISRIACAPKDVVVMDNYVDGAAYMAIAGECVVREAPKEEDKDEPDGGTD